MQECEGKKQGLQAKFSDLAKHVAAASGQPITFIVALSVLVVWAITGPIFQFNDTWQLVINTGTTIITFLMVFLIQNTQNRDSGAMQVKLDEIIRAIRSAHNDVIDLEDKSQNEVDDKKKDYVRVAKEAQELSVPTVVRPVH